MSIRRETDDIIDFLNELLAIDRTWLSNLVAFRTSCNSELAEHATVQVGSNNGYYTAGMLGFLNGFLGTLDDGPKAGWGPITAVIENGMIQRFQRTA